MFYILVAVLLCAVGSSVALPARNQVLPPWVLQGNFSNLLPLEFGSFEPSGLVYQSRSQLLLVASDVGGLLVLNAADPNMARVKWWQPTQLAGDWEGLCISDSSTDNVWLVDEFPPALQEFNYVTGAKLRRFNFPDQDLFTPKLTAKRGLESCTFVPNPGDATNGGTFIFGHAATGDLYRFLVPKVGTAPIRFDSKITLTSKPSNTKMSGLDYYADLNELYVLWQLDRSINVYTYSPSPTLTFVEKIVVPGHEIDAVAFNTRPFSGTPNGAASKCKSQFWVAEDTGPAVQVRSGNNLLRYELEHRCTEAAARNAGGAAPTAPTPPTPPTPPISPPPPPAQVACSPSPPAKACDIRPGAAVIASRKGDCDKWNNIDPEKSTRPANSKASCKSAFSSDVKCWKSFHSLMCSRFCASCPAGRPQVEVDATYKPCASQCGDVVDDCKTVLKKGSGCAAPLDSEANLRGQCSSSSSGCAIAIKSEVPVGSDSSLIYIIVAVVIGLLCCCLILGVLFFFLFRGEDDKKKKQREREERIKLERKGSRGNVRRSRRSKRDNEKEMAQMGQYGDPNQQYMADPNAAMWADPMSMYGFGNDPYGGAMSMMSQDYELMRGANPNDPFGYYSQNAVNTFAPGAGGGTLDARIYESAAGIANQQTMAGGYGAQTMAGGNWGQTQAGGAYGNTYKSF